MAKITIQKGHCFRKRGATGGRGEQIFADKVGDKLAYMLELHGHDVKVVLADEDVPDNRDIFIALHTDGSSNPGVHGASVGYPSDNPNSASGRLAAAWKRAHQRAGFRWGFHRDNYTRGLRYYYGFGRAVNYKAEYLAEAGMHSNVEEFDWMHSDYLRCAMVHVAAIGELFGHPNAPKEGSTPVPDPTPSTQIVSFTRFDDGRIWSFGADGGVFPENGAHIHGAGSLPALGVTTIGPIIKGLVTPDGLGYTLVSEAGELFHFGQTPGNQPHTPLYQEYKEGQRKIVDAAWLVQNNHSHILMVDNQGNRYVLF